MENANSKKGLNNDEVIAGQPEKWPNITVALPSPSASKLVFLAPEPIPLICPVCQQHIITKTAGEPGLLVYLLSGAICCFGLWLGCCLLPFCVPECQDVEHRCPECGITIGKYRRL